MTYILAVSGGVDSVVLLDMMTRAAHGKPMVVAHFDHCIRDDSYLDERHVRLLASKYGLPYVTRREELGESASEAYARDRRYAFLQDVAERYQGKIVTAHHMDDVAETIALNLQRGTGWRGLAVLDADILRPLKDMTKAEIIAYAQGRKLQWREDSTNALPKYARNRIRPHIAELPHDHKRQLRALHEHQRQLRREIEAEVRQLVGEGPEYLRYQFIHMPTRLAEECLRVVTHGQLTRPQLQRAVLAIKTAQPGSQYEAGSGVTLRFTTRHFTC